MISAKRHIAALAAAMLGVLALAACSAKPPSAAADGAEAAAQDYLSPPKVDTVRAGEGGVTLAGTAPVGGKVRLATPTGQAMFSTVDAQGRWAIALPPAAEPRIFGVSASAGGRQTQAEGYLLVTPAGQAALLRAGASAMRLDPVARPGLRSVDFDRGGGVEVAAQVSPGATVILHLDGRQADERRADANGRYEVSLGSPTPIRPGPHQIEVRGDGFADQVSVKVAPAQPLAQGPLRSQLTPAGPRVDWMTPGGGVQSTLLIH
ncbi:carboxypeptidase-like regulatory domain-containing protein [Phenylobacterium sp.]|uniref:carboxypeptidase-like regulatory domain-containing protein n=1 Tax=Phenylobacterium sp. TaxID=1871053 RepID=UPI002CF5C082|nr:carboxypeptidase-like regulatory domain-containing protein [Phenylobacterium sp.]HLZ77249.1 carboxypeptidase-like regulatory domain-containing protein [Phenylobacterium sp.]